MRGEESRSQALGCRPGWQAAHKSLQKPWELAAGKGSVQLSSLQGGCLGPGGGLGERGGYPRGGGPGQAGRRLRNQLAPWASMAPPAQQAPPHLSFQGHRGPRSTGGLSGSCHQERALVKAGTACRQVQGCGHTEAPCVRVTAEKTRAGDFWPDCSEPSCQVERDCPMLQANRECWALQGPAWPPRWGRRGAVLSELWCVAASGGKRDNAILPSDCAVPGSGAPCRLHSLSPSAPLPAHGPEPAQSLPRPWHEHSLPLPWPGPGQVLVGCWGPQGPLTGLVGLGLQQAGPPGQEPHQVPSLGSIKAHSRGVRSVTPQPSVGPS